MNQRFHAGLWTVDIFASWTAQDVGHCIEITRPGGVGALHVSSARKWSVSGPDADLYQSAATALPTNTPVEPVSLGAFAGVTADFVDWNASTARYWKKWWLRSGAVLLHITYTCRYGNEEVEAAEVDRMLLTLSTR